MNNKGQAVIGLMRHAGSEIGGSVKYYFSSLEEGLRSQMKEGFEFRRLPSFYTQLSTERIEDVILEFLSECDVVLVSAGGMIDHVVAPYLVRDKHKLDCRFIYNPLGEFPRGAAGFRSLGALFRSTDSIVFSCSADQAIYHQVVDQMTCHDHISRFGIDTDHFRPQSEEACQKLRWQLNIPEEATLLLYTGRITSEKNVHTLLSVYKKLLESHDNLFLLLLGTVEDVEFFEFKTGPHDLKEIFTKQLSPESWQRLRFFGGVGYEDLPLFYSTADLFVNLTVHHDENFGYTQVEAMSCGTPVVGSDWGGLKDTISDHETGIKVPCYVTEAGVRVDQFAAYSALDDLIKNPQQRQVYGQAARERMLESFHVDRHCQDIKNLIMETLDRQENPDRKNKLSPFGRSLIDHFKENAKHSEKTSRGSRPAHPSFEIGKPSYDLYRELIRPYASGFSITTLDESTSMLFLCSPFITIDEQQIRIDDPLWPFQYSFSNKTEKNICDLFADEDFLLLKTIYKKSGHTFQKKKIKAAIEQLVSQGVLIVSRGIS